jgi:3-dehydroquinate dehydratase-2
MKILIINGPNLNLLGTREPEVYGTITLNKIEENISILAKELECEVCFFQSNIEGELINKIQEQSFDGIIINPAGYSHTSVSIRDAISAVKIPTIEVHLSNIYKREDFRHKSLIAPVCIGQISGFGADSYLLALRALLNFIK